MISGILSRMLCLAYRSTTVGSSQEEGSEGQVDDHGCHKGSFDPSYILRRRQQRKMFDALVSLYQSENINRKMIL
jgi:hypothetical protein